MSNFYGATSLIGGGSGALDAIDGAALADLDGAIAITDNKTYLFWLDDDSAGTESSPLIIAADANGGNKRWLLTELVCAGAEIIKDAANATLTISCYHDTEATTPLITLRKADGTLAVPALVDDNAVLGTIHFDGHDGSGWHTGAKIEARINGTPSDGTDLPTELTFWTVPDASATLVQRMTILANGFVGFGTSTPGVDIGEHISEGSPAVEIAGVGPILILDGTLSSSIYMTDYSGGIDGAIMNIHYNGPNLTIRSINDNNTVRKNLLFLEGDTGNIGVNDVAPGHKFDINGNINLTGVLKIDDVQVIKEQQVHIVDAPGDTAANNATTINAILAMLETHGLVAAA